MAVVLTFRWNREEYEVHSELTETIAQVKDKLQEQTNVHPSKQKLMGLKTKEKQLPTDDTTLSELMIKPGQKIMMLGTPDAVIEETIKQSQAVQVVSVVNDVDDHSDALLDINDLPEIREKLDKRVERVGVKVLNAPRPGKKLLVIDIDYTIFDLGSTAERVEELARPYLHYFFATCYEHFDLMIWSANSMRWVEVKMRELGISNHADFHLVCMLDRAAMIPVQTERYGIFECKPLEFIWRKFPENYNRDNTVMLDDLKRNFIMNRQNGLPIRPFRQAYQTRSSDKELFHLAEYFSLIGPLETLSHIKHRRWEKYVKRAREGSSSSSNNHRSLTE